MHPSLEQYFASLYVKRHVPATLKVICQGVPMGQLVQRSLVTEAIDALLRHLI